MDSWSCLMPATFGKARMHACKAQGRSCQHRARRDGDRSWRRHPSTDTPGAHCMTRDGVHRSPQVDVLGVCGCGGSRTRTAACQELAKTGANRVDRATQARHADFADLGLRDAVEHLFTLSRSLGVKWSQVQILSARQQRPALSWSFLFFGERTMFGRRDASGEAATLRNQSLKGVRQSSGRSPTGAPAPATPRRSRATTRPGRRRRSPRR
jgi:hypothetical protein